MTRCPHPHLTTTGRRAGAVPNVVAALAAIVTVLAGGPAAAVAAPPRAALHAAPAPATPVPAAPSGAADGFTWAVQPSSASGPTGRAYFVYDAAPGRRIEDRVAITNLSRTPMTFAVYGADAFTTGDGGFALQPASRPATDVGSWVTIAERTYRIPAGKRVVVPFQVTVPANASPGDHAGGIVVSAAGVRADAAGRTVTVDRRVAARIYLRVAGAVRPALEVEALRIAYDNPVNPFGTGPVVVSYRLRNTGNVRLTGSGQVHVAAPFGWRLAGTEPVAVPELLPGAAFVVTEQINGIVPTGRLSVRVAVDPATVDGPLPTLSRTASTWAMPWVWVAVLLAGVAWLIVTRLRTRRRARAAGAGTAPAEAGPTPAAAATTSAG
ncbi:WxL protein peptidoglycan domain-containing protein [Micromonospora sp. NPDC050187]|uniref:WxL protein peptidoglycan domain-containing protein n=1 Tax=Micromonospora sp. NPDC050187 TaxID=3364277 RepID=UPI003787AF2D